MRRFALTYDYLCPFARNAVEHVLLGLDAGADWNVEFLPFSLKQVHVAEGGAPLWEREDALEQSGVLALLAGIAATEGEPALTSAVHRELFATRHDRGRDIRDHAVIREALTAAGADPQHAFTEVDSGEPMRLLRKSHERAAAAAVFGVPTFIAGDDAAFVRLMHRPEGDRDVAISTVERVLDLLQGWPDLNEFKHTRIPR